MPWLELTNAVGIVGALLVAAWQTYRSAQDARKRDEDARTERALAFHNDLVFDGETAAGFHRLSVLLRNRGSERHGSTTWLLLSDEDFHAGGILDPCAEGSKTAFQDLYLVLWFFERVETALKYGLVNEQVLFDTIGFHCWWWDQMLRHVHAPKATGAIHSLGPRVTSWAEREDKHELWVSRCMTDFGGGAPMQVAREAHAEST